jgi:hypothetical protein
MYFLWFLERLVCPTCFFPRNVNGIVKLEGTIAFAFLTFFFFFSFYFLLFFGFFLQHFSCHCFSCYPFEKSSKQKDQNYCCQKKIEIGRLKKLFF